MLGLLGIPSWLKTLLTLWMGAAIATTIIVAAAAIKFILWGCS